LICPAAEKKKPLLGRRIFMTKIQFPDGGFDDSKPPFLYTHFEKPR
jgi:hypothetical protein